MKATKFFRLKAEWEKTKQNQQPVLVQEPVKVTKEEIKTEPVEETIAPTVEEVKQEEPPPVSKTVKKKTTNV
jgi:hypothetical protein